MVEFLTYEGEPIAVPAFRIVAIVDGDIHAGANKAAFARVYALFEEAFGEAANVTSYNFPGHTGKIRWMNPSLEKDGRAFFERDATEYGDGLRRYGYALSEFEEPALPYFGAEQRSDLCFLELALPADDARNIAFGNAVTDELGHAQTIWAVMGLGFFLPPYKSSLEFELGRSITRYRASIEISPAMVTDGLRKEGSAYRWQQGEEPGIPDIGWKTLIGREFWPRIPDVAAALEEEPGITVTELENALVITAGEEPIWGDINRGDDIAAYRAIARHLEPIRYPTGAGKAFMFGGDPYDPRLVDRVEAYLGRYAPAA